MKNTKFYIRFFKSMLIFDAKIFENDSLLSSILRRSFQVYVRFLITKDTIYFEFRTDKNENWSKLNYNKSRPARSNVNIYKFFKKYPWLKNLSDGKFEITYNEITNLWRIEL